MLDAHQNETVIVLSELIIPETDHPRREGSQGETSGSTSTWRTWPEDKGHSFLMGLGWLDGYALEQHEQPFVKLTEAQQVAILEKLDGAEEEELAPGAEFFKQIKQLTVQGYYTSKIGIDELNKGRRPRDVRPARTAPTPKGAFSMSASAAPSTVSLKEYLGNPAQYEHCEKLASTSLTAARDGPGSSFSEEESVWAVFKRAR